MTHNAREPAGLHLTVTGRLQVDANASINVNERGLGPNAQVTGHSGGSYGGLGQAYEGQANPPFGDFQQPTDLGIGGNTVCAGTTRGGGGRVAVFYATEMTLPPANITASRGSVWAGDGSVYLSALPTVAWVGTAQPVVHGSQDLSWLALAINLTSLRAEITATKPGAAHTIATGHFPWLPFRWDTTALPDDRYALNLILRDHAGRIVADLTREVQVLNTADWHAGALTNDAVWAAGRLHLVEGAFTVASNVTLTVSPGAVVKFVRDGRLVLDAGTTLDAAGESNAPVVFTAMTDDTAGGDSNGDSNATRPAAGDWGWIFMNGGAGVFQHCQIRFGGGPIAGGWGPAGDPMNTKGMLKTAGAGASLVVSNCVLQDAFFDGVLAWGGEVKLVNSVFAGMDRAVCAQPGSPVISVLNCTLDNNRIGLLAHGGTLSAQNTIVAHSLEAGVQYDFGPHRWQVTVNARDEVFEGLNRANNTTRSRSPVALDLPGLGLASPRAGQFTQTDEAHWFKIQLGAGKDVLLSLDLQAIEGATEIFIGRGYLPTPQQFDIRQQEWNAPDAHALISGSADQTYYALVQARSLPGGAAGFNLSLTEQVFSLSSVEPATIGNAGSVATRSSSMRIRATWTPWRPSGSSNVSAARSRLPARPRSSPT